MEPKLSFADVAPKLVGQMVTDRQLAANSLSIWVATSADPAEGYTIWLEPSWHVVGPAGVVAGSRQAQDEDEPTGWQAVSDSVDQLVGRRVEGLDIDHRTGDLIVRMSDGYLARTFVTDPRDGQIWWLREVATDRVVFGSTISAVTYPAT